MWAGIHTFKERISLNIWNLINYIQTKVNVSWITALCPSNDQGLAPRNTLVHSRTHTCLHSHTHTLNTLGWSSPSVSPSL